MAKLGISTGTIPNDGTGDSLLAAGVKINNNFNEVYTLLGDGTNLSSGIVTSIVAGVGITLSESSGSVTVTIEPSIVSAGGTWDSSSSVGIYTSKSVGIGTTNPLEKLTVGGNVFAKELIGIGTRPTFPLHIRSNPGAAEPSVVVSPFSTVRPAAIRLTNGSESNFILGLQDSSGNGDLSSFPAYSGVVGLSSNNPLIFVTNSIEGFRLSEDGNFGLNRNAPTSKLDVFGDAKISGVITATSFIGSGVGLTGVVANYTNTAGVATYSGVSGVSSSIDITNTNGLTTIYYPTFVENRTTGQTLRADVDLTYKTDDNILTVPNISVGSSITVSGTAFTNQLSVSGISTFGGQINPSSSGILFDTNTYTGSDTPIQLWIGNSGGARYFTLRRSNGGQVTFDNAYPTGHNDHRAPTHSFTQTGSEYYASFYNGSVKLYHPASASGILDQKFETIGAGVTVTGTTFTNQLSVSGISTLSNVDTVDLNVTGVTSVTSLTSQQLNVSGISTVGVLTATSLYGDASRTISGSWTVTGDGYNFTFVGIGLSVPTNDPVMYFARGCTYHIINNDGDHPFEIRDQENGFAYNNGVVGNGGTMTTIKFTVPLDAPNTLYYQCTDHVGMGNTIRVYPDRI